MAKVSPPPMGSIAIIGISEYSALWSLVHQAGKPVPTDRREKKARMLTLRALAQQVYASTAAGDVESAVYFDWLSGAMDAAGVKVEP